MKKIKIFVLSLASSIGAFAVDIDVTPGSLESLLADQDKGQTEIKLKGKIDARDLAALENLSSDIKTLDLKDVEIQSLSMPDRTYFGRTLFSENEIPRYTFFRLDVENLVLPQSLQTICEGAFAGSAIRSITVPEGVTSIGDFAFYGCKNLESISLPSTLKEIGKSAFGNCVELTSVNLASTGITALPDMAFAGDVNLASVALPASVTKIGREAFSHTKVESLSLSGVREFEAYALSGMPFLKSLSINPSAQIGAGLLMDNISLSSLSGMPEFLPDYFAANCGQLPTETAVQAASLGRYSLANTLAPETLILTAGLARIDRGALSGLGNITSIDATQLEGNVPDTDNDAFEGLSPADITLIVTKESMSTWKADPVWSLFKFYGEDTTGVEEITTENASAGINIGFRGGNVIVASDSPLTDIRIYTTDGRVAYVASPGEERVEISAASLPSGIIVVTASDAEGRSATSSILLK